MKALKTILFLIVCHLAIHCIGQEKLDSIGKIQLDSMLLTISPENRAKSIAIMRKARKNFKKNYAFYQGVNYDLIGKFKSQTCDFQFNGLLSFNTIFNSRIAQTSNNKTNNCQDSALLNYDNFAFLFLTNFRWLKNWAGFLNKKHLNKVKFGIAQEDDLQYKIIIKNKKEGKDNRFIYWVNKKNYAITSAVYEVHKLHHDEDNKRKLLQSFNSGFIEVDYQTINNKYHPNNQAIYAKDYTIVFDFLNPKEFTNLKKIVNHSFHVGLIEGYNFWQEKKD